LLKMLCCPMAEILTPSFAGLRMTLLKGFASRLILSPSVISNPVRVIAKHYLG